MLLSEPPPTSLDLRFRLFGTDVRVHPFFWLVSVVLGWDLTTLRLFDQSGMVPLLLWVLCCFLSILLHEFGHVWMGRLFGSHGYILLHGMGGLAIGSSNVRSRWQRVLVIAAGPGIQLVLFATLLGLILAGVLPPPSVASPHQFLLYLLLDVNLRWAILNLFPIWPLDGGQIVREVFSGISPRNGAVAALWVSLIIAVLLALHALLVARGGQPVIWFLPGGIFMAVFFAYFAIGSWQAIQEEQRRNRSWMDDDRPW